MKNNRDNTSLLTLFICCNTIQTLGSTSSFSGMFKHKFLSLVTASSVFLSKVHEYDFFRFPFTSLVAVSFEFLSNVYEYYCFRFPPTWLHVLCWREHPSLLNYTNHSAWTFTLVLLVLIYWRRALNYFAQLGARSCWSNCVGVVLWYFIKINILVFLNTLSVPACR